MTKEELIIEILKFDSPYKKEELLKLDNVFLHGILRDFQLRLRFEDGKQMSI